MVLILSVLGYKVFF